MINMKKTLIKVNNYNDLKYPSDGFILGVLDYSFLFSKTFSVKEIKQIIKENKDKEIFAELNYIVPNSKIDEYKNVLKSLDKLGLKGIIVGDIAALTYNLETPIILNQLHLNNSSLTINHYYKNGVAGFILTNDITIDEINTIRKNTKAILFKEVFTLPHLSTSLRKLVSNYKNYFDIDSNSKNYYICENKKNTYYSVIEDSYGTHILGSKVLNLFDELYYLDVNYIILNNYMLDNEKFKKVLDIFINNDKEKSFYIKNEFDTDKGFINKKTIYKVKKDE